MIDAKKVGERIAALRRERGLTGEKFSELLGVSAQAISKWETGKNLPETALLPDIARLLGISIDSILVTQAHPVKAYLGGHYIDGVPRLQWGQFQDSTWAGSVKLLLDTMGMNATYPEIMGFSGACYYLSMTTNWCPSACMPQIAYDPAAPLAQAVGVERLSFAPEDSYGKIKEAISHGTPVMLIHPRVEMEWGVLCGYTGDNRLYGRSYFDYLKPDEKDVFTANHYFLADSYPQPYSDPTYFQRGLNAPCPLDEALKTSLETARWLYTAEPRHNGNYVFGFAAYDILINGLRLDDAGFASLTQYGATGNGLIILTRLIDARRASSTFWAEKSPYLSVENACKMREVSKLYAGVVSALGTVLPNDVVASSQNGYPFEAWSAGTRSQLADALAACKELEQQAMTVINDVLQNW